MALRKHLTEALKTSAAESEVRREHLEKEIKKIRTLQERHRLRSLKGDAWDDVDEWVEKKFDEDLREKQTQLRRECVEGFDLEAHLEFAEGIISNPDAWEVADDEGKGRLYEVLFPEGVEFDGERFWTDLTCILLNQLRHENHNRVAFGTP